ncbi:hypothetical protein NKG94_51495 [Micromonospora sp. M12]
MNELAHPEPGYYAVGMKSYGRAPTFLMATGYEQVRSVVAALAGDCRRPRRPTRPTRDRVCNSNPDDSATADSCCGPPRPPRAPDGPGHRHLRRPTRRT